MMKTFYSKAVTVFLLVVMLVNQSGPAYAAPNKAQPADALTAAEPASAPIAQRELGKKTVLASQPEAAEPEKVKIKLSADPKFVTESGSVKVQWELTGDLPAGTVLKISFPTGYAPTANSGYDAASQTLSIPVNPSAGSGTTTSAGSGTAGEFMLDVQNPTEDVKFPAILVNGAQALAEESLALPLHEKFESKSANSVGINSVKKPDGALSAQNGRIKVRFGKNSLPEDATINIGTPAGDTAPIRSLSGKPFEIDAQGVKSKKELHQFDEEVALDVSYADMDLRGKSEYDLRVYYYDPETKDWSELPTEVDTKTKTLHAITSHFSVFDSGINDWSASHLPTLDAFQVSSFTGAATYSMPIEVPAGPGGLQPSLSLSYNSQIIDQSTADTQASWVGMGWSLGMSSIELNDRGTNEGNKEEDWTGDDNWFLNINGVGSTLIKRGENYYALEQGSFMKYTYTPNDHDNDHTDNDDTWEVQDKTGNRYFFEKQVQRIFSVDCKRVNTTYQWMLTRIRNIFEKELVYTYNDSEIKIKKIDTTDTGNCRPTDVPYVNAVYPATITYPENHYQISFELENRYDYRSRLENMQRRRLKTIYVKQSENSDGNFENIIRKYDFEYASDNPENWPVSPDGVIQTPLWPGIVWEGDGTTHGRTTTLLRVHQYGKGGIDQLPTATFTYGDQMHLTEADNGYGGSIVFDYEDQPFYNYFRAPVSKTVKLDFEAGNSCSKQNFEGDLDCITYSHGAALGIRGTAIHTKMLNSIGISNLIRPGGFYKFTVSRSEGSDHTTLRYGFNNEAGYSDNEIVVLPASASKADVLLKVYNNTNPTIHDYVAIKDIKIELLTSVYRVAARRISDGQGHTDSYTYQYEGAAVNDTAHSGLSCTDDELDAPDSTCRDTSEKYSEFRGHREVTEIAPDGHKTITTFYQDDFLKGRSPKVTVKAANGKILTENVNEYLVTHLIPENLWLHELEVLHIWITTTSEENRVYHNNYNVLNPLPGIDYDTTKTSYEYGPIYGNLKSKTEAFWGSAGWTNYRQTNFEYVTNTADGPYLAGLPSHQWVTDAGGAKIAETFNLYDDQTASTVSPTVGILTAVRTWTGGTDYSQVSYGYDDWGNRESTSVYNGYASLTNNPTTSPITQKTDFDTTYHTYPTKQYTPAMPGSPDGFVTEFDYDYTLGLPIKQTDANLVVTKVEYDNFGRLITVSKDGDGTTVGPATSPTLQIVYNDDDHPFTIELKQKIDATHNYYMRHTYDGIGREILTETGNGGWGSNLRVYNQIKRVYGYDADHLTLAMQSTPYDPATSGPSYTSTVSDALGRPLRVTSPDKSSVTYSYDGLTTTVKDANGNYTTTEKDIVGKTETVTPPTGPTVEYKYDALGQLTNVKRAGQETIIRYKAGQKIYMSDPDMGIWYYKYDKLGNLIAQVDANQQATNLYYDALNRLVGKTYSSNKITDGANYTPPDDTGNYIVSYGYDSGAYGKGRRTRMSDATGFTTWSYDARGRVTQEIKTIGTSLYTTSTSYNAADMPVTMTYPGGESITNRYNAQMQLDKITSSLTDPATGQAQEYIKNIDYDAAGRVKLRVLGNNNQSQYTYYAWNIQGGRLRFLQSGADSDHVASLQNIEYAYFAGGNIKSIADSVSKQTQSFTYDALDRLTNASVTGIGDGLYNENYEYDDATGNLKTKAGVALTYDIANHHVHAVKSTSNGNQYGYDNNGNQITRTVNGVTYNLTYDPEGHLITVERESASPVAPTATATNVPATATKTATPLAPTTTPTPGPGTVTFTSVAAEDGWVLESTSASEAGGTTDSTNNTLFVGDDASNKQYRGILSFDTSSLPDNAIVQSATLRIKKSATVGTDPLTGANASNLRIDIAPAPGKFGTGYALQAADFEAAAGAETVAYIPSGSTPDANGWFSASLSASGKALVSLINKTQLRLRFGLTDNANNTADYVKFISSDYTGGGNPELVITYTLSAPTVTPTKTVTPAVTATASKTATATATATSTPPPPAEMTANLAEFTYDGDGKMVKSVIDGVTTIFVSPVFQIKTDPAINNGQAVATKYYPGGAMRVGGVLYYTLSDHLGSTSMTTNVSGEKIAEVRYKAWGEVRYQSGDPHTDKGYTGQRSYASDFGLQYYNARWYDSYLNHFTQPDTIIPSGPQGLDRYAYTNNNPVNHTDPSGHCSVGGNWQDDSSPACIWIFDTTMGVTFTSGSAGAWTDRNKMIVRQAVWDAARAEGAALGLNAQDAFNKIHNGVNFTWGNGPKGSLCENIGAGGCTYTTHQIYFASLALPNNSEKSFDEAQREAINNVVHELGHSFGARWFPKDYTKPYDPAGPYVNIPGDLQNNDGFYLYPKPDGASLTWRQHGCIAGEAICASETYADMYVGWVYGKWADNKAGIARNDFMTTNMTTDQGLAWFK